MNSKPILINKIDTNLINISKFIIENNTRKNLFLSYNNNDFILQTPELLFDNNIKDMETHYELNLKLICRNEKKTNNFISFLTQLDNYLISLVQKNKSKYFNCKKIKFKSIIRLNKEKEKYIKIKILKSNLDNNIVKIVNNTKTISIKDLNEKCYLKLLININAIWINNNIFGVYIKPLLINKRSIEKLNHSISFIDDSETTKTVIDSCVDSNINTINNNSELNDKVLISTNNTTINNLTITETISNINNNKVNDNTSINTSIDKKNDDMTTINFNNLDDIPEYNNDPKKKEMSSTS